MFHRIILAAASVVALTAAANAADMYRPAEGGYKDTPFVGVNWSGLYFGANGGYGEASNDSSISGGFGGGQIGYNIQRGNIVAGLETDIQGSSISGSNTATLDYFGTVRGRVGYAIDKALVYGTGGFAYGDFNKGVGSVDGWVAGGGVEYKFNPSWSAKAEYQYLGLTKSGYDNTGVNTFRVGVNYFVGSTFEPLK